MDGSRMSSGSPGFGRADVRMMSSATAGAAIDIRRWRDETHSMVSKGGGGGGGISDEHGVP